MRFERVERLLGRERNVLLLCGAAFCMAMGQNAWLVGLPFVVKDLGGSDMSVSWCLSLFMTLYCAVCVLGVGMLDRMNIRHVLRIGAASVAAVLGIAATLVFLTRRGETNPAVVRGLLVLCSAHGLLLAAFWPPLMAWVSFGQEGAALSRRLARFNIAWSSGAILGPYLGGNLVEYSWRAWAALAFACFAASLVQILFTQPVSKSAHADAVAQNALPVTALPPEHGRFLWAARMGLVLSFVFLGVMRTHLGIVFKFELGYTESQFGSAVTFVALMNLCMFLLLARWHGWHYRAGLFFAARLLIVVCFFACLVGRPVGAYYGIAIAAGIATAFVYTSHQFYASSGAAKRSAAMAAHEGLLGLGFMLGSLGSGWVSDHIGRWSPYWLAGTVVGVATALELAIWRRRRGPAR